MKTRMKAVLASGLLMALGPLGANAVPVQWGGNSNWYEYIETPLLWEDADVAAASSSYMGMTGHLLTITSAAEQAFIVANFSEFKGWVGGFQPLDAAVEADPSAGWQWVTGEDFSFSAWAPGNPDDARNPGFPEGEDYLELLVGGGWNDAPGFCCQGYFVEYEAADVVDTPEPTTLALLGLGLLGMGLRRRKIA